MSLGVIVQDDVIQMPMHYRSDACDRAYRSVVAGDDTFQGVAPSNTSDAFGRWLTTQQLRPSLTFFRRSPAGQAEPHYIHHDAMMGDWTAILYLSPEPHPGDGTVFWEHTSGQRGGDYDMDNTSQFTERFRVKAQFNRAVIFPSKWFHSRALFENYGTGDDARLIQVAFGKVA